MIPSIYGRTRFLCRLGGIVHDNYCKITLSFKTLSLVGMMLLTYVRRKNGALFEKKKLSFSIFFFICFFDIPQLYNNNNNSYDL